eukprot:scaffold30826_cov67-Phaeocystis_antarctica.AAC.5
MCAGTCGRAARASSASHAASSLAAPAPCRPPVAGWRKKPRWSTISVVVGLASSSASAWPTGLSIPSGKRYGLKRTPTKPSACRRASSAAAAAGSSVGLARHMPRYRFGCALKAAVTYEWSNLWLAGCTISAPATPAACVDAVSAWYVAVVVSSSGGATAHGYGGWPFDHTCTALSITLHVCSVLLRAAGADASVATSTRRVNIIAVAGVG